MEAARNGAEQSYLSTALRGCQIEPLQCISVRWWRHDADRARLSRALDGALPLMSLRR